MESVKKYVFVFLNCFLRYPYLCVKQKDWKAPIKLDDNGLFYANRMEEFISTMETETVAGRNIANWIWKDLNK